MTREFWPSHGDKRVSVCVFLKHQIFGYGTEDSRYRDWYLKLLAWLAPRRNWVGVWRSGSPRPLLGNDQRVATDAEFREIIKQNLVNL